jgi:two-component sensor histidine kinase
MAVTELVQNAIEHGLDENGGVVDVALDRADGILTVSVADGGVGLPDGFDVDAADSLGLRIVLTMVRDRGGELRLAQADPGTVATIELPVR